MQSQNDTLRKMRPKRSLFGGWLGVPVVTAEDSHAEATLKASERTPLSGFSNTPLPSRGQQFCLRDSGAVNLRGYR